MEQPRLQPAVLPCREEAIANVSRGVLASHLRNVLLFAGDGGPSSLGGVGERGGRHLAHLGSLAVYR